MATYAIGDIQGCYDELRALLERLNFSADRDRLWFTGDLVNRGPQSLQTLRFVKSLADNAITVLGNHDLHLLAVAFGRADKRNRKDTLDAIYQAPDRLQLYDWLCTQPLLHHDAELGFAMVHAGLPPQWSLQDAVTYAAEMSAVLRDEQRRVDYFATMYGNKPDHWHPDLTGQQRLRFITNCFTRLRYLRADGVLCLNEKGPPGSQSGDCVPWFTVPDRASRDQRIIFGHWSTLQMHTAVDNSHKVYPLDNGCLWGGRLTALRLDDQTVIEMPCAGQADATKFS